MLVLNIEVAQNASIRSDNASNDSGALDNASPVISKPPTTENREANLRSAINLWREGHSAARRDTSGLKGELYT